MRKKILTVFAAMALSCPLFGNLIETIVSENFEDFANSKLPEAENFKAASPHEITAQEGAISGNSSIQLDTTNLSSHWNSLLFMSFKKGGIIYASFKYRIVDMPPNCKVFAVLRESAPFNGKKNRIGICELRGISKKAHTVVFGGATNHENVTWEFEINSDRGAKIIVDDLKIEKFIPDERNAWMFKPDGFIGMRYKPTNPDFCDLNSPFLFYTKEQFMPFIDRFGQFKHKDWEGKIKSVEDFQKRIAEEKKFYKKIGDIPNRDKYFGLVRDGYKYEATGRFYPRKIDGKWFLITPEGNLFYSYGITCAGNLDTTPVTDREFYFEDISDKRFLQKNCYGLHYYKKKHDSYGFLERNLVTKYGDNYRETYGEVTDERIRKWGFTTYGCWTQNYILRRGNIPFTAYVGSGKKRTYKTDVEMYAYWHDFPDFFTPGFEERTRRNVARIADLLRSPACVGVFVDNEIPWQLKTLTTIRALLGCPEDQPGKIVFMEDMKKKYREIEKLNSAWNADYKDWGDFLKRRDFAPKTKKGEADMLAFEKKMYEFYFDICRRAVKDVSPDVLYLGCRFAWRNQLVERVSSRYCDVISYNVYSDNVTNFSPVKGCEDKPVIIGEFHFGNTDKGVYGGGLNARKTVYDRSKAFEDYSRSALENPNIVGAHWFQWFDLCTTGRFNEANYAIGFVDICDTPDYVIAKSARKISQKMYDIRLKGEKSTVQSKESSQSVIDD